MIASLRRIFVGLLIGVPVVAATTYVLLLLPQVVSFVVMLLGLAAFIASETFHSKLSAAIGGVLMMGGMLAWALVAAQLVGIAG